MTKPNYVYVASSWRNPMQPAVVASLRAAGIDCYDFRDPAGDGTGGFSWKDVRDDPEAPAASNVCACGHDALAHGLSEATVRCMADGGRCTCRSLSPVIAAKGTDWVPAAEYLRMIEHPAALHGYGLDYAAMERADAFVMVLPCGKSAHLEAGWAMGAGKPTAILLEDPVEPELMYRTTLENPHGRICLTMLDLLGWLGVED